MFDRKLVLVTRKTALEELTERFNTRSQAKFYIEHSGGSFAEYENAHERYHESLVAFRTGIPRDVRLQVLDRGFLPTFQFGPEELVATLGPDGLVVNTAKYLDCQPILAVNPDPARIDGILLPFDVPRALLRLRELASGATPTHRDISMARARLNDGQELHAVNDLFIGPRSHTSARYEIAFAGKRECQSTSGIIVSTGTGSTGWLQSVLRGATAIAGVTLDSAAQREDGVSPWEYCRLPMDSDDLWFTVREPFVSRTSQATLVFGRVRKGQEIVLTSHMPENGVIFSDGIEADRLDFNSGAVARIGLAERKARLLQ